MVREKPLLLRIVQEVLGPLPWIVAGAVPDFRYGCTAALGLALVGLALEYFLFRTERTKVFPKVLNMIQLALFLALTILSWADRKNDQVYKNWAGVIINGGIALGCVIATLFGRPFVADYAADGMPDEAAASHPFMVHTLAVINWLWVSCFALMAAVAAVGVLCTELMHPPPGRNFQAAFKDPMYLMWVILVPSIAFTIVWPIFLKSPKSKPYKIAFARKHDREYSEWAAAHPDHEFAQKYRDWKAAEAAEADGKNQSLLWSAEV